MRKALLCAILILSVMGCGKSQSPFAEDTLDRIRRTGVIEACAVDEPPCVIKDAKTGALSGVYVDALTFIAQKMNAKVNWHETTFGNATADLASNRCDIVVAEIYSIIPRADAVNFIQPPLNYQGISAIVRKNDKTALKAKSIFEFDKPGITEHFKKATIRRIDVQPSDLTRHLTEVSAGRADIALYTDDECVRYARSHPEVTVIFRNPPIALFPINWAVRQDDLKWGHFMATALQFLDTQGTLAQLEKKYHAHLLHRVEQYKLQ